MDYFTSRRACPSVAGSGAKPISRSNCSIRICCSRRRWRVSRARVVLPQSWRSWAAVASARVWKRGVKHLRSGPANARLEHRGATSTPVRYNCAIAMTLGVYIQVPFCQTKCTYCNFHTGVVSRDRYQPYANAVSREVLESAASSSDRAPAADTVYFGGGTPSLLDSAALAKILDVLRANYLFETPEITLEADPETITPEKAKSWLAAGFNRISLGVQSFNDRELRATGRMHRRADIA